MNDVHLLLVDDEPDFTAGAARRFKRRGVAAQTAGSGREALMKLGEEHFDVVLLDVKMPGMDGLETLREIRKMAPEAQVILLTGHAGAETAAYGVSLGAFEYMLKPVVFEELFFKVMAAVHSTGTGD